jgi:hypothetical protein
MYFCRSASAVRLPSSRAPPERGAPAVHGGDKVTVELTPYDLSRARIVFRAK